ncbi:hypothetical protein MKEN_00542000 [Mycena kentingensis (nom. inval.)]|nr:hypothetical protein MKEN_00542000 [Mycena kentingensis (nom. inval.)]
MSSPLTVERTLPKELIIEICTLSDKEDLYILMQLSHFLHAVCAPLFYHTIVVSRKNLAMIQRFFETITNNELYASAIRELTISPRTAARLPRIDPSAIQAGLEKLTSLETLNLPGAASAPLLQGIPLSALHTLNIGQWTSRAFTLLAANPQLRHLKVSEPFEDYRSPKSCKRLDLSNLETFTGPDIVAAAVLQNAPKLQCLRLAPTVMRSKEVFKKIATSGPGLRVFELELGEDDWFDDDLFIALKKYAPNITTLIVDLARPREYSTYIGRREPTTLDFTDAFDGLEEALPGFKQLFSLQVTSIGVHNRRFYPDDLEAELARVEELAALCPSLRFVDLDECGLSWWRLSQPTDIWVPALRRRSGSRWNCVSEMDSLTLLDWRTDGLPEESVAGVHQCIKELAAELNGQQKEMLDFRGPLREWRASVHMSALKSAAWHFQ